MSDVTGAAPEAVDTSVDSGDNIDTSADDTGGEAPQASAADQAALHKLEAKPNLTKSEIKRLNSLKLKVDGKEYDEALPFDIPDTPEARDWMTKNLQFSKVSQKRMSEFSKLESEAKQFIEELRKNPEKILSDPNLGIDMKKMAAKIIEEEIANSQKSPDQLEKEKLQSELKKMKDEREKERTDAQRREFEATQKQAYEQYDLEMTRAIEKSDLPKSPYVVKKMADYLYTALQNGVELSAEDVLPLVRDEVQSDLQQMFEVMPQEVIEKILGKGNLDKLRKSNIAKAKGLKAKPPVPVQSSIKDVGTKPKAAPVVQKQTFKDFFKV